MADLKLSDLRCQIDAIDDRILDLLNQRARLVIAVGKAKAGGERGVLRPQS